MSLYVIRRSVTGLARSRMRRRTARFFQNQSLRAGGLIRQASLVTNFAITKQPLQRHASARPTSLAKPSLQRHASAMLLQRGASLKRQTSAIRISKVGTTTNHGEVGTTSVRHGGLPKLTGLRRQISAPAPSHKNNLAMMVLKRQQTTPFAGALTRQRQKTIKTKVKGKGILPRLQWPLQKIQLKPFTPSLWPNMPYFHNTDPAARAFKFSLPKQISNSFVISMRDSTLGTLRRRLGPWSDVVAKWNATNGRQINTSTWKQMGYITAANRLTRGQIGCYDSHVSIWQAMVEHNLQMCLIFEDDAEFHYSNDTSIRLHRIFNEIADYKARNPGYNWHLLYLGTNLRNASINRRIRVTPSLTRPTQCVGLFCYLLTLDGAKILLEQARPYTVPIDIYTVIQANAGRINALYADPSFGYVFSRDSDTRNIK